jgi:hypothetical protein
MPIYMVLPRLFTCPTLSAGYVNEMMDSAVAQVMVCNRHHYVKCGKT